MDYSELVSDFRESWIDFFDKEKPVGLALSSLLKVIVTLPMEWQYELLVAYSFLPSALCSVLPTLIMYGQKGTGKSTIGKFISLIHDISINGGADSFAAVRNDLENRKWNLVELEDIDEEKVSKFFKKIERNAFLVWDDVDCKVLLDQPNFFRMLKSGYDRATDTISIAAVGGKNLRFNCFCPKVISSITPIWGDPRFSELERRILVVKTAKKENHFRLELDEYNWDGLNSLFKNFWDNIGNVKAFLQNKKKLSKQLQSNSRNVITRDIMATGITIGLWASTKEAIIFFDKYWEWYGAELACGDSALLGLLKEFIEQERRTANKVVELFEEDSSEFQIAPKKLKNMVDAWAANGMLEQPPSNQVINLSMNFLGWRLVPGKWVEID